MSNTNTNKYYEMKIIYNHTTIDIEGTIYDDILSKCRKNKSKTCLSVIQDGRKQKIYMDSKESLFLMECRTDFTLLRRVACEEEIKEYEEAETTEAEDYKELLEFCINNIRDTENNSISDFRKMKWITFCEKNKGAHILTEALTEYNKRKRIEELKEDIEELKESLVEKEEEDVLVHCTNKDPIKHNVKELRQYANKIKEEDSEEEEEKGIFNGICNCNHSWDKDSDCICKDDDSEEEKEYEYNACSISKIYKVVINVAGGGLTNGNVYANIEGEWKTEEDYENGEEGEIFYCEYGSNPIRVPWGTRIVWGDDNFKVE